MDFASIIGLALGFGSLVLSYKMDGGELRSLMMLNAVVIVFGGAFGSVFLAYGFGQLKKLPALIMQAFTTPKSKIPETIDFLVMLSENARKDGLLSLEKTVTDQPKIDSFLKRGVLMVIDGADLEQIRELLENDIHLYEQKAKMEISMFDSLASFAPSFGMIGTIVGLVQVLGNMESPEQMAKSIGVAFIATLYGVVTANMFCLPITNKLKIQLSKYCKEKEMIIEGICAIRNGVNPKMLREKLSSYLIFQDKSSPKGVNK